MNAGDTFSGVTRISDRCIKGWSVTKGFICVL